MTGTLDASDDSIVGLEHLIAVERKPIDDLLACIGRERVRFKRALQWLSAYRFRLLVVEADAPILENGTVRGTHWRSTLQPAHVLGSLAVWTAQYGLPMWPAGDHDGAASLVERHLYQCAPAVALDCAAAVAFPGAAEQVVDHVAGDVTEHVDGHLGELSTLGVSTVAPSEKRRPTRIGVVS